MTCLQIWVSWGRGGGGVAFQTAEILNKEREQGRQGARERDKTAEIMANLGAMTSSLSIDKLSTGGKMPKFLLKILMFLSKRLHLCCQ